MAVEHVFLDKLKHIRGLPFMLWDWRTKTNINHRKSLYFFFRMRLNQLSKHFCHSHWRISKICILNSSTAFLGVEKRWPLILFFRYGNKKKSFCAKSGLYGGWLIEWGEEWSVFGGLFSWFLGSQLANKWLCATCPAFPKKQAIIWLEVLRTRASFVVFGPSWNIHTVDCCLLSGSYA